MEQTKDAKKPVADRISLKTLAAHLNLDPATISVVLNDVPGRSIPEPTRERIRAAARDFNYQPSLLARSLRNRKTMTIGILVPLLGEGYHTEILSGIGDYLLQEKYFYFIAHHRHRRDLIEEYPRLLLGRGAEGLILIDTLLEHKLPVPVIAVAGHRRISGVTNIVLDHDRAAQLALHHLYDLGHRKIAFMRGHSYSSDADLRWQSIVTVAKDLGIVIRPELIIQLDRDLTLPEPGYPAIEQLLSHHGRFTALFSFNDVAAMGAIRALHDARLRVPKDVSVVGFDDIKGAAFHSPSLTTIRQPLYNMGQLAAKILLERIRGVGEELSQIAVEPELVIRESTDIVRSTVATKSGAKKMSGSKGSAAK